MEYRSLTLDDFLSRFQLLRPQINRETLNHRQAAVLIPIVRRPQPGLLLTQRSIHLRKHAGQVAFPGGAPFPSPGNLPDPGIEPECPVAPALAGGFFTTEPSGKPPWVSNVASKLGQRGASSSAPGCAS